MGMASEEDNVAGAIKMQHINSLDSTILWDWALRSIDLYEQRLQFCDTRNSSLYYPRLKMTQCPMRGKLKKKRKAHLELGMLHRMKQHWYNVSKIYWMKKGKVQSCVYNILPVLCKGGTDMALCLYKGLQGSCGDVASGEGSWRGWGTGGKFHSSL